MHIWAGDAAWRTATGHGHNISLPIAGALSQVPAPANRIVSIPLWMGPLLTCGTAGAAAARALPRAGMWDQPDGQVRERARLRTCMRWAEAPPGSSRSASVLVQSPGNEKVLPPVETRLLCDKPP